MMRKTPELYLISMAAEMLNVHPQTLRKYERLGLVRPLRTLGSMRVYTAEELARVRLIKTLVDEAGVNLAGVQRLLSIAEVARRLRPLVAEELAIAHSRYTTRAGPRSRRSGRSDVRRRLEQAIDELFRILGIEETR
jgi:MerR family transcriptional regulator/heat shock protein HspR